MLTAAVPVPDGQMHDYPMEVVEQTVNGDVCQSLPTVDINRSMLPPPIDGKCYPDSEHIYIAMKMNLPTHKDMLL
ncbi:hypothetical protein PsorP6_014698 [Peronosclerospora sorghi]|uniref:Uncharacterized protein n=1 Tax=Peronosclerospora sorghi TaxID=230839 RepID=A0ACC0VT92_9STRA|nr:hypothetical protein PsorP6_014698 [Peronosclerospora sorghi]